jgi:hypothetical protein
VDYLIFSPLPGEYIASAIRRGNEILGIKGLNKLHYRIRKRPRPQGKYDNASIIDYPKFLTSHKLSSQVLYENTLYPLAAALGRTDATCVYTPPTQWKICLQCVIDDLENQGTAFIHRSHLMSSVSLCSRHATKLHFNCPNCLKPITSHEISQFAECSESYTTESPHFGSPPHQYSCFVEVLLNYKSYPVTTSGAEIIIIQKMEDKGILEPRNTDVPLLIRLARETLGVEFRFEFFHRLPMEACSVMAFLAYITGNDYLGEISGLPKYDYL